MAKRTDGSNALELARRKLAKAQIELHEAQEKRTRTMAKGERDVEQTRLKAERRLAKATQRVERRAALAARAETHLISLSNPPNNAELRPTVTGTRPDNSLTLGATDNLRPQARPEPQDGAVSRPPVSTSTEVIVPDSQGVNDSNKLVIASSSQDLKHPTLRDREHRALVALASLGTEGATSRDWRRRVAMPETTFLRARRALSELGMVALAPQGAHADRYVVTDMGKTAL